MQLCMLNLANPFKLSSQCVLIFKILNELDGVGDRQF